MAGRRRKPEERLREEEVRTRIAQQRTERLRHQVAEAVLKSRKAFLASYQAAEKNRTNRDWRAKNRSADAALLPDLPTLIARSRQMVRDDPYIASATRAFKRNVIGKGITPRAMARDEDGAPHEAYNKRADALWFDWARRPKLVDKERRRSFVQIQRWAVSELAQVGDCLIIVSAEEADSRRRFGRMSRRFGTNRLNLVLQCVESEQLDQFKFEHEGRDVRGGVEVDEFGAAVAYWIFPHHPNDARGMSRPRPLMLQSQRIPADRVLHIMDPDRARQTRGVTRYASAMVKARDLGQYDYAQLLAARAEACIGFAIKKNAEFLSDIGLQTDSGVPGASGESQDADGNDELSLQPLMIARLADNEEIQSFLPQRPASMYEPFIRAQLRAISAASGVSYEQVARDFSTTNFSGLRQGMLEDRREYETIQELIITQLAEPVWEMFIELAIMNGDLQTPLDAPMFHQDYDRWIYAEWRPQGWDWVDPLKESAAAHRALADRTDTLPRILAAKGIDWREAIDEAVEVEAYELEARRERGLPSRDGGRIDGQTPVAPGREPLDHELIGKEIRPDDTDDLHDDGAATDGEPSLFEPELVGGAR